MRYQTMLAKQTREAVDVLFRNARAIPADKLEWSPLGSGRTVLDQLQECAHAPVWMGQMLVNKKGPATFDVDGYNQSMITRKAWNTVDECERVCRENTGKYIESLEALSDEDLEIDVRLPLELDKPYTLAEIATMHHWNLVYHTAQISYIQTLLGDFKTY